MAALCRFGAAPRMTRIHANKKKVAARRADPSLRRERAVAPNPPAGALRRRGRNFGIVRDLAGCTDIPHDLIPQICECVAPTLFSLWIASSYNGKKTILIVDYAQFYAKDNGEV
jgi:hypothetical protein